MNRKNLIIFFITILFLVGACNLASHTTQSAPPNSNPSGNPSVTETATQPPLSGGNGQGGSQAATQPPLTGGNGQSGSQANVQSTFPLPPDSQVTQPDDSSPTDTGGGFTIQSQSSPNDVNTFYAQALPPLGWTLRYTDANFTGGVTQYWKKDNIYLSVNIGFDQGMLNIHCQYERVEAQLAQKLPKGFPLPSQFEMVQASDSSWEFYIPQDYSAVTNFYKGQMASLNWKQNPGNGAGGQGGCGDPGCGGSPTFPAGAMPTATIDYRNENDLSYTMPDGNVVELTITPHTDGTILDVNLTLNNVASAGLPQDVPIYPGATAQIITPGSAEFQVNADLKTIEDYYNQQLPSAGWTPSGSPMEVPGSYMQDWIKGSQNITITLVTSNANTMLMIECSTCSQ
ncbi:MAG: hypothetical protein ABSA23_03440 [Anaerolineales bacterium]|jgi:hypothetical protein